MKRETFLKVRHITKIFGHFVALQEINLDVYPGELVCILGPSGCGKTTLLRIIAGLEEQNTGQIFLKGEDISRLPTSKRQFGIVFQSYALFPNLSASQNVAYGLKKGHFHKKDMTARTQEMLELVGLGDIGKKYPAQLSGGQQQRVALARALAPEPAMLLLDEPLSALDAQVRVRLRGEIRDLQQRLGITTVMVTHDQEEALTMADRVVLLESGRLIQCSTPTEIYHAPVDPFVARFIGSMNFMNQWNVVDHSTLRFGNVMLKTKARAVAAHIGKDVTVAIRPEDVRIFDGKPGLSNTLQGEVEHIEFRGSFYRVRLRMQTEETVEQPQLFEADVQADVLENFGIKRKQALPVRFPPERLLLFDPEKSRTIQG